MEARCTPEDRRLMSRASLVDTVPGSSLRRDGLLRLQRHEQRCSTSSSVRAARNMVAAPATCVTIFCVRVVCARSCANCHRGRPSPRPCCHHHSQIHSRAPLRRPAALPGACPLAPCKQTIHALTHRSPRSPLHCSCARMHPHPRTSWAVRCPLGYEIVFPEVGAAPAASRPAPPPPPPPGVARAPARAAAPPAAPGQSRRGGVARVRVGACAVMSMHVCVRVCVCVCMCECVPLQLPEVVHYVVPLCMWVHESLCESPCVDERRARLCVCVRVCTVHTCTRMCIRAWASKKWWSQL